VSENKVLKREYLDIKGSSYLQDVEDYATMNFIVCTLHQLLLMDKPCNMHGELRNTHRIFVKNLK
jgi:hypothetical protein